MSKRTLRRATFVASFVTIAAIGAFLWLSSSGVEVEHVSRVLSPDGRHEAVLDFRVYTGYLGGNPARSEVRVARTGSTPSDADLVFAGDMNPSYTKLEWASPNHLKIGHNHFDRDVFKKENTGEITVSFFTW
jgi:hypothetical protein